MTVTIIVEDGSKVPNSNSYVNAANFIEYAADRGYIIDPSLAVQYLVLSMDYIESVKFIGVKSTREQSLEWPRYKVFIDSWWFPTDEIPSQLVNAQCEVALQISKGNDPLQDRERKTTKEKVNGIEVMYALGSSSITVPIKINNMLQKLVAGGNTGGNFTVDRA